MSSQPYLPGFDGLRKKDFGGSLLGRGNPRDERPLSMKRPVHLVMRSTRATGERSLLSPRRSKRVEAIVRHAAEKRGIKIYRYANSGNHLHILLLTPSRTAYAKFVRAISGLIARLVLGAEKGRPKLMGERARFWDARPFTRIVEWGRDFRRACAYLLQNRLEALGFIPYQPRSRSGARSAGGRFRPRSGSRSRP